MGRPVLQIENGLSRVVSGRQHWTTLDPSGESDPENNLCWRQ